MKCKQLIIIGMLLFGSLIENIVFLRFMFTDTISFFSYILVHSLIMGIIYIYVEKYNHKGISLPLYIAFMIPGMGVILVLFLDIALIIIQNKPNLLENYHKYIEYINELISRNKLDFEKELNVVSALDSLKLSNAKKKKNVIIDLISDDIDLKINILRRALNDEDPEVVHYASSIINLVEAEYEISINELKDQYVTTNSEEVLKELIIVYDDYLSSGLINENLLRFEQEEYLNIINEYIEKFGYEYDVMIKKVDILIKMNNNEEALYVLKSISNNNKETNEHYFYKLKALYNIKENKEVIILAEKIKNSDINIPDKYMGIIEFWT